jgi:chaperonin cofactor prefoldin
MSYNYKSFDNEIPAENLTQKDIMLHLLQVAQHSATREDVKNDINNLDAKIDKLDSKIDKVETNLKEDINKLDIRMNKLDSKIDKVETNLKEDISKVETNLKEDISKVDIRMNKLDSKIDKVSNKFDRIQWLIISTILTVLLKDYIVSFFKGLGG